MISRLLTVGVALLGLTFAGSVCSAQESAAPDSGATPGRAAIGAALGVSQFIADADYSEGAQPRLAFAGVFRYVMTPGWRLQIAVGHTWTAYEQATPEPFEDPNFPADSTKDEYLTQLVPASLQIQYLMKRGNWVYHAGVGPGLYRVWVQNRRKVLKDPVSLDLHRGVYTGMSGQIGAERFLVNLPSTSVEFTAAGHWVFAQRDEQFPSGYNSFLANIDLKVGVNYYFTLPSGRTGSTAPPTPGGP